MAKWVKAPSWLANSTALKRLAALGAGGAATLSTLATDPTEFILNILAEWLVGGFLDVVEVVVGAVQAAFAPVVDVPGLIAGDIMTAVDPFDSLLFRISYMINQTVLDLQRALGVWAPFVLVPAGVLIAYGVYVAGVTLVEAISPRVARVLGLGE